MVCVHCGSLLPHEAYFCNKCGRIQNVATNGPLLSTANVTQEERTIVANPSSLPDQPSFDTGLPPQVSPPFQAPSSQVVKEQQRVSRRTVAISLVGIAVAITGGATVFAFFKRLVPFNTSSSSAVIAHSTYPAQPSPKSEAIPTATTTTEKGFSQPLGTLFYTYHGHTDLVTWAVWSPDGKRIASCSLDKTAQVWDATTGKNVITYQKHTDALYVMAWPSKISTLIASGSEDTTVHIWNTNTAKTTFIYRGHSNPVYTLSWSPDAQYIASSGADGMVQVWIATTGRIVNRYTNHTGIIRSVDWSPDGQRIASASEDKTVRVWSAGNSDNFTAYTGHTDGVLTVSWSPDGRYIASAGRDKTVQVWDAATGQMIYTYHGHSNRIWSVSWSPDGTRIASAGKDNTVHLWDATTGNHVFVFHHHTDNVWSAFWSPDGQRIASASNDGTVQIWQGA